MQVKLFLVKRLRAGFFEFQQLISFLSEKLVIRETNDLSTICNWKLKSILLLLVLWGNFLDSDKVPFNVPKAFYIKTK